MYKLVISRVAEKQIEALPKQVANSITHKIDLLQSDPRPDGCKKLQGNENAYRVRCGDYRIIYRVEDKKLIIEVIRIGNRKDVYKKR